MKTHVIPWKGKSLPFLAKTFLLLSFILTLSCESEEFVEPTESNFEEETFLKATPVSGKTYYLRNKKSGLHMDVANKSNNNGANIQQWGNASGTNRQWQVISVGSGYFRLKGIDSGKSITVKDGSNSNGANIESRSYNGSSHQEWQIISVGSGYYRLKSRDSGKSIGVVGGSTSNGANVESRSWNGNDKFRWFFTEVGGVIDPPPPPPPGGTAASIIGSGWKLNGFSGSLSVGSNDNGLDYKDDASTNESHFFFENNGYATFRCYAGNPTSGNSKNPRSELREEVNGGDGYWDGTTNTEHSMKWRFRVEDLPPSGKLCFGQIHERDDSYDDVIRVQVQGSSGQNSGSVDLRILGYVTENLGNGGETVNFNMSMDTEYYFELTMKNSVVKLYELNNSGNRVNTLYTSPNVGNADENYFKAGAYLQSTSSSHSSSNVYGQVAIKDLSVN